METLALQTRQPIEYSNYLNALLTQADKYNSNRKFSRDANSAQTSGRGGHGGGRTGGRGTQGGRGTGGRGRGSDSNKNWRNDLTQRVPYDEWKKLSKEEQDRRTQARAAAKASKARQANASEVSTPPTPATITTTQDAATVQSAVTQPTIRDIMAS
jgi:hypothetical protein